MFAKIFNLTVRVVSLPFGLLTTAIPALFNLTARVVSLPLGLLTAAIAAIFNLTVRVVSLPIGLLTAAIGALHPVARLLQSATREVLSSRITLVLCLAALLIWLISCCLERPSCQCQCIRISAYDANGVSTPAIIGCLYCEKSGKLQAHAEEVLSSLRSRRNKHGAIATGGTALILLGECFTGPLFDILSGNWLGVAYRARSFYSINTAVNMLKAFIADVLTTRQPVTGCQCKRAAGWTVSGVCEFSSGSEDQSDSEGKEKVAEFDKGELVDHFQGELSNGNTMLEAVQGLFDLTLS